MIPKEVEYITIVSQDGSNFVIGCKSSIHPEYMNSLLKGKPQDDSIGNHSYTPCKSNYYNDSTLVITCKYRKRDVMLTTVESVSHNPAEKGYDLLRECNNSNAKPTASEWSGWNKMMRSYSMNSVEVLQAK